jgi:hypothetical protein
VRVIACRAGLSASSRRQAGRQGMHACKRAHLNHGEGLREVARLEHVRPVPDHLRPRRRVSRGLPLCHSSVRAPLEPATPQAVLARAHRNSSTGILTNAPTSERGSGGAPGRRIRS